MEQQVQILLTKHSEWSCENEMLIGEWKFNNFTELQGIVVQLCELAEKLNHHPTVTYGYNTLRVETTTHDADNQITELDLKLAESISMLIGK